MGLPMNRYVIDYFELPTAEMAASRRFFTAAFGFGQVDYGPGYSEITGSPVLGALNAEPDVPTPVVGIRTDDIAAAVEAVHAAGGAITVPVYDYPGGQRFFFREPGGNVLMCYCPAE